jgi:hypothetical protein
MTTVVHIEKEWADGPVGSCDGSCRLRKRRSRPRSAFSSPLTARQGSAVRLQTMAAHVLVQFIYLMCGVNQTMEGREAPLQPGKHRASERVTPTDVWARLVTSRRSQKHPPLFFF